jgi:hypothetical protein
MVGITRSKRPDWMKSFFVACLSLCLGGCAAMIPTLHAGAAALAAHAAAAPIATAALAAGAGLGVGVIASDHIRKLAQEGQDEVLQAYPAGTFGAFLQDRLAEVKQLATAAMSGQREGFVVAGLKTQGALENALSAYAGRLGLKMASLEENEQKFVTEMQEIMADLRSEGDLKHRYAGDRARTLAASLPAASGRPRLSPNGPIWLFPFLPSQSFTVSGSFPAGYEASRLPELVLNGKRFPAFNYQADSLQFHIPTAEFAAPEPKTIVWRNAQLEVPLAGQPAYAAGSAKFDLQMALLPHSFGYMTVEHQRGGLKTDPDWSTQSIDLAWGSKHHFRFASGTWKLRYFRTGGGVKEVSSSDISDPLIAIRSDAGSVRVSVYPF